MKTKVLLTLVSISWISFFNTIEAQRGIRIGYIDMEYILENVPEYKEAAAELETKVQKWKVEIEAELKDVDQMRKILDNERVLLTKELIDEREEDILFKEKEILKYQQQRFGPKGDLFIQERRLVEPVQDQVFVAVQEVAKNKKYDFVFDKSADMVMLYSADRYDISDQVLLRINRVSKRKQINSKKEKRALEQEEKDKEDKAAGVSERDLLIQEKLTERNKLIEERKKARDSLREVKKREYELKRAELLEAQKRRKDSIREIRENVNENGDN